MDELRVIWTRTALNQRNSIFDYWNKRNASNDYSKKLNLAVRERLKDLKNQPEMGYESIIEGVRTIAMRHYSIFYVIDKTSIFIVSFWDNRQDPEKLLDILNKD